MLNQFGSYQGDYHVSAEVNGKLSYVNDAHAIWFIDGLWLIGNLAAIGQNWNPNVLMSLDDFNGLTVDNQWLYFNGASLDTMPPSDISIDLTTDHFMYYMHHSEAHFLPKLFIFKLKSMYRKVMSNNMCY